MNSTTRRTLAVALTGVLALSLSACNRGDDGADTGSGTAGGGEGGGESLTLAVSTLNNPFFISLRDGAQAAADEAGVELEVVDAQNDAATQQNQLANAATQQADAVIINPVDSEAAAAAVTPVQEADIPVIAVDRSVEGKEVNSTVSSDNVAGGRQAADALAAIADGTMVATIAQQPGELGRIAVELALQAINGEDVPTDQPVEVVTVTSENVAEYQ
jgi:ribose transport system substrate-binding protein